MSSTKLEDLPDNVSTKVLKDLHEVSDSEDLESQIDDEEVKIELKSSPVKKEYKNKIIEKTIILYISSVLGIYSTPTILNFIKKYMTNSLVINLVLAVILVIIHIVLYYVWEYSKKNIL